MSTERKIAADQAVLRSLLRLDSSLSDSAIEFLMQAARATLEYRSHTEAGEALDVTGLVDSVKRSEVGQLVWAEKVDEAAPDHEKALRELNPQQRMNYARKHGLS